MNLAMQMSADAIVSMQESTARVSSAIMVWHTLPNCKESKIQQKLKNYLRMAVDPAKIYTFHFRFRQHRGPRSLEGLAHKKETPSNHMT